MYLHTQQLINEIVVDRPDPAAANALQEGLGGQFGEMRTMMQYLFQSINFRGVLRIRQVAAAVTPRMALPVLELLRTVPGPVAGAVRTGLDILIGLKPKARPA